MFSNACSFWIELTIIGKNTFIISTISRKVFGSVQDMAAKTPLLSSKTKHSLSLKVCINRLKNRSVSSSSNLALIPRHRVGSPVDERVDNVARSRGYPKAAPQPQPAMMPNLLHNRQWGTRLRSAETHPALVEAARNIRDATVAKTPHRRVVSID